MKTVQVLLVFGFGMALSACCSKGVKREQVAQIKRVAIVGFEYATEKADAFEVGNSKGIGTGIVLESEEGYQAYGLLAETLSREMKWSVLPAAELGKSEVYRRQLDTQTIKMSWDRGEKRNKWDRARTKGVLLPERIHEMGPRDRTRLIEELGVDALVVARVDVSMESGFLARVVGIKNGYPVGTTYFDVYDRKCPIWWDGCAKGDKIGSGTLSFKGLSVSDGAGKDGLLAAQDSFRVLMVHFNEATGRN